MNQKSSLSQAAFSITVSGLAEGLAAVAFLRGQNAIPRTLENAAEAIQLLNQLHQVPETWARQLCEQILEQQS